MKLINITSEFYGLQAVIIFCLGMIIFSVLSYGLILCDNKKYSIISISLSSLLFILIIILLYTNVIYKQLKYTYDIENYETMNNFLYNNQNKILDYNYSDNTLEIYIKNNKKGE